MSGKLSLIDKSGMPLVEDVFVSNVHHGVSLGGVTRDSISGWSRLTDDFAVSNQRIKHQPFQIIKRVDSFSPLLMEALLEYKQFREVNLDWHWVSKNESYKEFHYRIELNTAQLICIEPYNFTVQPNELLEKLVFTYESIIWRYDGEGKGASENEREAEAEGVF